MSDPEREATLNEWLEKYGDMIAQTCQLYLNDRMLAEDAAQETFIRAWRHMGQFEARNNASAKAWLISIAINTCRNVHRSAWFRRVDRHITPDELPTSADMPDRTLLMMVNSLQSGLREIVLLRYFHGMNLDEAAQTLGIARSTAYHRQQKALRKLRIDLEGGLSDV